MNHKCDPHAGTENLFSSLLSHLGGALDTSAADTSYHPYPASRPFINSQYQRPPEKPAMSFPESNRDGVMSALKNLQERMRRLEVERRAAENNLRHLASETEAYKSSLRHQATSPPRAPPTSTTTTPRRASPPTSHHGRQSQASSHDSGNTRPKAQELESQLSSAETRCQMLERQLDYMRRMVQTAEQDRVEAVQKAEALQQQQQQASPRSALPDYCAQLDRISELERDHLRLTATQTLAEAKIKELEKKLKDERDHRKMLQERALDLESAAVSHQILLNSASSPPSAPPKGPQEPRLRVKKHPPPPTNTNKKKKKTLVSRKQVPPRSEAPSKHYRLNLADIPFVAGKSTAPSHAVGANVQKVLALMKAHNLALCSSLYNGHNNNGFHHHHHHHQRRTARDGDDGSVSSSLSSSSSDQDLADLLAQLQDEFGQLSCEHQDLLRQIQEEKDPTLSEAIEKELDSVLQRMEAKGQQISSVRQHQQKMDECRQQARGGRRGDHVPRPASALGRMQQAPIHAKAPPAGHPCRRAQARPRSSSGDKLPRVKNVVNPSLNVLKDMKKLQSTLRRDDLHWE